MSIYRVSPSDVETFSVITNPIRSYTSSSFFGSTGSVHVFPRRSDLEKEVMPLSSFVNLTKDDSDLNAMLATVQQQGKVARNSISSSNLQSSFGQLLTSYLSKVDAQGQSVRKFKAIDVYRFTPSFIFSHRTVRKLVVKENLAKYYRTVYPSAHWAYTNYSSLNFFTSSTVPTSSCLLYPNIAGPSAFNSTGYCSGAYTPSGSFSFDFYINPRYQPDAMDGPFKAGTILHLSSTYALSLVSGSLKDANGRVSGFRLQLQLSQSADIQPSSIAYLPNSLSSSTTSLIPGNLVFLSNDNALRWNNWHHVVVRWGTNAVNSGTGSFNVDGVDQGTFVVPSSSITPLLFGDPTLAQPSVLCVGNFWEGNNRGTTQQAYFFAANPAQRDGITQLMADNSLDAPVNHMSAFNHPLNAEVHDLTIRRKYMSNTDIAASASVGPRSIVNDTSIAFYLPPFFTELSPFRQFVNSAGGILQTPFFEVNGTTTDPFNLALSHGVGGHYINIENFLRDFANNVYPRVHHMTGVAVQNSTLAQSANWFLYDQPFVRRRNLLIMPCDDGNFVPGFDLLSSESFRSTQVDDTGAPDLSFINIDNQLTTGAFLFGTDFSGDSAFPDSVIGPTPENPNQATGSAYANYKNVINAAVASGTFKAGIQDNAPLTILQRTRDPSSNQVTFFDVSNLYYGTRILPGSFTMQDTGLTGSSSAVGGANAYVRVTLKDDGFGNIYRADCLTSASTWNSVGNIYYNEGIIAIKSPHLYFYGQDGYQMSFRGEHPVHVMKIDVLAPANQMNSSSNPAWVALPPSPFPNDPDTGYVNVSGINFHDADFNVLMKTSLAQSLMKRFGDRALFRVKMDF